MIHLFGDSTIIKHWKQWNESILIKLTTAHLYCDGHSTNISVLWDVRDKGQGSSFQKGTSHTYILRLGYSRIYILYPKNEIKLKIYFMKYIIHIIIFPFKKKKLKERLVIFYDFLFS